MANEDNFFMKMPLGAKIVAGSSVGAFLGAILPWVSIGPISANGFDFWQGTVGFLFGVAIGALVICAFVVGDLEKHRKNIAFAAAGLAGFTALCVITWVFKSHATKFMAFGYILSFCSALAMAVGAGMWAKEYLDAG